jgi:hypothetical protein
VQLSAGAATYETATPDGHYAYYTEAGQLWRFDLLGYREALQEGEPQAQALALAREALTEPGAAVQGVIGVNEVGESGSYLYFVAAGKLTPDAEARKCEAADKEGTPQESGEADEEFEGKAPPGRGCNLYLLHAGTATLVATLSPGDNYLLGAGVEEHQAGEAHPAKGVWRPVLGYRAAQLSPDGHHLVFMSQRRLTAYDNLSTDGGCNFATLRAACAEVYLYDAGSAEISCASCAPTGIPPLKQSGPSSGAHGIERGARTFLPGDFGLGALTHMRRLLSADGDRVFFDTDQPLASADTNGHQDVYEWERAGRGTCVQGSPLNGGGCVYLLSGGTGPENAYLIDVSASGSDAFLVTRSPLVPTDSDDKPDLYDVREGGGFPLPVAPVICGGRETCRGPAPSPPALKAPATATFDASESPPKCRRGFVKKRGRCIKRHRHAKKRHHNQAGHDRGGSK